MRSDRERLLDIQEAIIRIEKYAGKGRSEFERNELIQNWIIHHIQIIGETAARVSSEFRNDNPEIPWREIVGMRNILVHDYFGLDVEAVWKVVERDLSNLKMSIDKILKQNL